MPDEIILWHQARREQGSPVVTALRGAMDDASRAWIDCWRRQGRPVVGITQFDPEPLALAWIGSLVEKPDFLPLCLATIARANGEAPGRIFSALIEKPEIELELFLDRVVATHFGEPVGQTLPGHFPRRQQPAGTWGPRARYSQSDGRSRGGDKSLSSPCAWQRATGTAAVSRD
ncbi:MAG: hypothetical protein M3436_05850 [Pseudomonadota bacterium]|nr:hypothetical protein [Pseudomonadota bacterium]